MKKVLFTDLVDTLINSNNEWTKEVEMVSRYLNEFLSKGNYVAVVTSPNGHGSIGYIFNDMLIPLHQSVDKSFRDRLVYYLQGNGRIYDDDNVIKKNTHGKIYYLGNNGVYGIGVSKKEEAIDDFLQVQKEPFSMYAIGDSDRDIPMLLRVQELGGFSSFIGNSIDEEVSIKDIIDEQLFVEFHFSLQHVANKKKGIEDYKKLTEEEMTIFLKREERRKELYQLFNEGKLDIDKIKKDYYKIYELSNYQNFSCKLWPNDYYENYPFNKDMIDKILSMGCFNSFEDYYVKVLKR
ncbi:MAG TPA: hypothetical protein IAB59_04520 [Candidatus Onthousia faecipullorum]|uniref:Haloacid dehalogenase-like hydrolase n=1 Tax=Candidatus Onthousia faecipullorum TaxID=2840887 RepID=A0A9D1GBD7_9FIRM|nr:hypothetical protein [Candidatus Onthousia faecipullorum]